jgi:hypothetical protein
MVNGLIALCGIAIALYAVFDVVLSDARHVRRLPAPAWLALVIVVPVLGALLWLRHGRPHAAGLLPGSVVEGVPVGAHQAAAGSSAAPRAKRYRGPEDDPAFILQLAEQLRRRDPR